MLDFYRRLNPTCKVLVWGVGVVLVVLIFGFVGDSARVVAGAQIAAALGTLALAALAYAQVNEMRRSRIAQERPHVIVDTDHSKPPLVDVVVRNIGKGAAKDITFEFSAPMETPESIGNPIWPHVSEQPYFKRGIDYLAPGAEIPCFWGSMITLAPFLREQGLDDGITVTSRYSSLTNDYYETEWTVNPLLMEQRASTNRDG